MGEISILDLQNLRHLMADMQQLIKSQSYASQTETRKSKNYFRMRQIPQ